MPALISLIIIICQLANTIIFGQFAYNFGQLYILLDDYMRETDSKNIQLPNSTNFYRYNGINEERIKQIDLVFFNIFFKNKGIMKRKKEVVSGSIDKSEAIILFLDFPNLFTKSPSREAQKSQKID